MIRKILIIILSFISLSIFGHKDNNHIHSDFFGDMQPGDKAAILMVHFGTTHSDTRTLTIDALNNRVKNRFPDTEVREAYTSRIIIKRLKDSGIIKQNPLEALNLLYNEGYTHILIQTSTIIDGVEMESLNKNADEVKALFKDIRVSNPLLFFPHDYEEVISVITKNNDNKKAYVLVGHGTSDAATAQYAMLDYMLKSKGYKNFFVGTIEGYPEFDDMLSLLKDSNLNKVILMPFMFVAGEHAKNDIAGDWKEALEKEGFSVNVDMKGLGENPHIQDIYISHLTFMTNHRKIGIMKKKSVYEKTGEKMNELKLQTEPLTSIGSLSR